MLTTTNLATFLQLREGFRKHAYDDKNPNRKLSPGDTIEGTLTIGYGTTFYPSGEPVKIGDTVSKTEALDYLNHYIQTIIEPAIENLIHRELTGYQYDAIGSLLYQYGESEVAGWNLIRLINRPETSPEALVLEWINGTVMWMGRPLFWTRRVSEVFMYFGLDWMAGANVPSSMNIFDALKKMGWQGSEPERPDEDLFEELEIPRQAQPQDPTPDTPLTTEDLNSMQKVAITPITKVVPIEAVDYLEDEDKKLGNITVKKASESQRGKGDAKQEVGKISTITGVGGTAGVAIGAAEPIVEFVDKYPKETIAYVFAGLITFGIVYHFWGKWQRQKGEAEATDLLG